MSITPLTPAENSQGGFRTWVKSQRKFLALPGQLSAEINTHNVAETFCAGPFHVHIGDGFAVLTFTQARIAAEALFHYGDDRLEGVAKSHAQYVVVARLALPVAGLIELRDTLNKLTKNAERPSHAVGGTQH